MIILIGSRPTAPAVEYLTMAHSVTRQVKNNKFLRLKIPQSGEKSGKIKNHVENGTLG